MHRIELGYWYLTSLSAIVLPDLLGKKFWRDLTKGLSWPWSYGSWIYNYLCNQCPSPLMWVQLPPRARCTTLCDKVCQWLTAGQWFSPGPPLSSTNKTDRHDITEILLKVALNTIKPNQSRFDNMNGETLLAWDECLYCW
jgi:hypothetical protein